MERGVHSTNLNLDKIIQSKISQNPEFLSEVREQEEEDKVMKALTLILTYIKQIDEKNSKVLKKISDQQDEILNILKKN